LTKKVKNSVILIIVFVVLFICGFYLSKLLFEDPTRVINRTQIIMGTISEIKILNNDTKLTNQAINDAFEEIKRIDELFSTYNKKSFVWNINYSNDEIINLNDELYNFILICDSVWKVTDGAYDPALGVLTSIWRFETDTPKLPPQKNIRESLKNSGWNKITLLKKGLKKNINIKLDFSSVAKGYAVDKAIEKIKSMGIKIALVNIGGEVKGIGKDWNVGIKHPRLSNMFIENIILKDFAIATSGDYENYFMQNGKRYNHILNPQTGYSANLCQSVTIITKNTLFADALSTACFVLGAKKSIVLIEGLENTECLIIDKGGNKFESKGFNKFRSSL